MEEYYNRAHSFFQFGDKIYSILQGIKSWQLVDKLFRNFGDS